MSLAQHITQNHSINRLLVLQPFIRSLQYSCMFASLWFCWVLLACGCGGAAADVVGSTVVDRLIAATHFGEVGANNNHIIVYVGGDSGARSLTEDIQRALGLPAADPPCLDLRGADVQLQFQDILLASDRQGSEYTLVVALGTEVVVSGADNSEANDMARVLDFLYLVSDKSSVHRNVVVLVAWKLEGVPRGASSELAEQYLANALQPLASDTFNPASFLGRILTVHAGDSDPGEQSVRPWCGATADPTARALSSFVAWLRLSCFVAVVCYAYIAYSIVTAPPSAVSADQAAAPDEEPRRAEHASEGSIALATRSHDSMDPTHHRYSSSEEEGPVSSVRLRERQCGQRWGVAGSAVQSSVRSRRKRSTHRTI